MKKMRIFKFLGLSFLMSFLLWGNALGQGRQTPEQAAKDFYRWYLQGLNSGKFPVERQKQALLKKVSARLGKWIYSKAYREYGADYFLDAQDWDENWVQGVTASRASIRGNTANLKVSLAAPGNKNSGFGKHTLAIKMVRESGAWRIDRVAGQNN